MRSLALSLSLSPEGFQNGSDDVATVEEGQRHQQEVEGVAQVSPGQQEGEEDVS